MRSWELFTIRIDASENPMDALSEAQCERLFAALMETLRQFPLPLRITLWTLALKRSPGLNADDDETVDVATREVIPA